VVSNDGQCEHCMVFIVCAVNYLFEETKSKRKLTPFVSGMIEAASVAMLASSKNTTGKSNNCNKRETEEMHVAQTCSER
jgi:hypothetical protein